MDLPSSFIGSTAVEGEIYFFEANCPVGVPDHPHVLVRHKDTYLFFNTCSSSLDTAVRLAKARNWPEATYPVIEKNSVNNLTDDSYINCNQFVELTETEFGEYVNQGYIHRDYGRGVIDGNDMDRIKMGIEVSINLSAEDIDRILS